MKNGICLIGTPYSVDYFLADIIKLAPIKLVNCVRIPCDCFMNGNTVNTLKQGVDLQDTGGVYLRKGSAALT
jgi:hypothetical protein